LTGLAACYYINSHCHRSLPGCRRSHPRRHFGR